MGRIKSKITTLVLFYGMFSQQVLGSSEPFEAAYQFYKSKNYKAALAICTKNALKTTDQRAACLTIEGFVFMDSISFAEGIKYFVEAKKVLNATSDPKLVSKVYFGLGKAFYNTAQYKESIREFLFLEKFAVLHKLKADEKSANFYLAQDYQALGKIAISNTYAKRGLQLSRELNDTASIFRHYLVWVNNYCLTGTQYLNTKDSVNQQNIRFAKRYGDSAIHILHEMEQYTQKSNFYQMAVLSDLYSGAYFCLGNVSQQIAFCRLSMENFEKFGDKNNAIIMCNKLGDAYSDFGKYDSALIYLNVSKKMKREVNSGLALDDERVYNYNFYRAYKGLSQYEKALEALEKYLLQDLKLNENRSIDLQQIREQFDAEKTRLKIAAESERAKSLYERKRNLYMVGSAGILLLLGLMAYFLYYRFKSKREQAEKNLQILLQNAELTALKAQMNPHFIFNALNSIQHSIVTNNTDEAFRFLSKFSKLIRNVLDSSAEQLIPLHTEIETLCLYLEIESKRFDNSFSFELKVEENGHSKDDLQIPPMVLQPFIENAIWHGLMPKDGEKKLAILFSILSEKTILCEISDNGIGREKAREIAVSKGKRHKSRGIENIMDRVKLLRMTLDLNVLIEIEDKVHTDGKSAGTTVLITFQKEENRV